jgi:hypothetical protein
MKIKILNILLVVTSLFGYLEWGKNNNAFLYEVEYDVLNKLFTNPQSVVHPFTVIPLFGQLLLLITLISNKPNKYLTYGGMLCLGILLVFIAIIGAISLNIKILISTIPFLMVSGYSFHVLRNEQKTK